MYYQSVLSNHLKQLLKLIVKRLKLLLRQHSWLTQRILRRSDIDLGLGSMQGRENSPICSKFPSKWGGFIAIKTPALLSILLPFLKDGMCNWSVHAGGRIWTVELRHSVFEAGLDVQDFLNFDSSQSRELISEFCHSRKNAPRLCEWELHPRLALGHPLHSYLL